MGYNLISVLKDISTKIGNIIVPNPGTNIDDVATAVDNLAGGKDLGDIETILTTMNGNIANLGTKHITNLTPTTGGYLVSRGGGGGGVELLPNEARYTSYTDTNNIGATDVQGAIDKLTAYSEGAATINTTYLNGTVNWQKLGRIVSVALEVGTVANLPSSNWEVALISNLPPVLCPMSWIRRWTLPSTDNTKKPLILGATATTTVPQTVLYSWGNGGVKSGTGYSASFMYISK